MLSAQLTTYLMSTELHVCGPSGGPENHTEPTPSWPSAVLSPSAQIWVQCPPRSQGGLGSWSTFICSVGKRPLLCESTVKLEEQEQPQEMLWEQQFII